MRQVRAIAALLAGAALLCGSAALADGPSGIAGAWRIDKPVTALQTAEGKVPPLKPAAAKVYRANIAARAKGDTSFDSTTWCAAPGAMRLMTMNYPFEIVVRPRHIAILHEWNWWGRVVYMNKIPSGDVSPPVPSGPPPGGMPPGGPPPGGPPVSDALLGPGFRLGGPLLPGPMGLSAGKWAGDTLEIVTDHFLANTLLDKAGLPHSKDMKLTERFRLIGPDLLEDRIRVEDAQTYSAPWETVLTFKRYPGEIKEDVCLDRIKRGEPAVRD